MTYSQVNGPARAVQGELGGSRYLAMVDKVRRRNGKNWELVARTCNLVLI